MGPLRQRRSHNKSRNGCSQCKERRIKCDEEIPNCGHCSAKHLNCSLGFLVSTVPQVSGIDGSTPEYYRSVDVIKPRVTTYNPPPKELDPPVFACYSRQDLELFHHFTSITLPTVTPPTRTGKCCGNAFGRLACSNDFLMRSICALSAIHLDRLRPRKDSKLLETAISLQNVSIGPLQDQLQNITRENCHAVFASCLTINCFTCALLPRDLKESGFGVPSNASHRSIEATHQNLVRWVHILRGTMAVVQVASPWLKAGPLAPFLMWPDLFDMESSEQPETRLEDHPYLAELEHYCTTEERDSGITSTEAVTYSKALSQLRKIHAWLQQHGQNWREDLNYHAQTNLDPNTQCSNNSTVLPLAWPVLVSDSYISLLDQAHPEALCILAYNAALISESCGNWWIEDVGRTVVLAIDFLLQSQNNSIWKTLMQWPLEKAMNNSTMTPSFG